jgi:hypothetical protein
MREYIVCWRRQSFAHPWTSFVYYADDPGGANDVPGFPEIPNPSQKVYVRIPNQELLVHFLNLNVELLGAHFTYDGLWQNDIGFYWDRDSIPVVDAHFYSTSRPRNPDGTFANRTNPFP